MYEAIWYERGPVKRRICRVVFYRLLAWRCCKDMPGHTTFHAFDQARDCRQPFGNCRKDDFLCVIQTRIAARPNDTNLLSVAFKRRQFEISQPP